MKAERVLIVLLGITIVLQAATLYKQQKSGGTAPPSPQAPARAAVQDVPSGTMLDVSSLPVTGNDSAKIMLVEFSDYECPYCARHAQSVAGQLGKEYIETGKLKLAFANNPLPMHPNAKLLATAAICAGSQGAYWKMHDKLFEEKPKSKEAIIELAKKLDFDSSKFQICLTGSNAANERIEKDLQSAKDLQLSGTPAFALGRITANGKLEVQKLLVGAQPFSVFKTAIGSML